MRADLRAKALRDAEHDPADQRAPERARPADHRRLEGEDQLHRTRIGVEGRAQRERGAGDPDRDHGDGGRDRLDEARVDADEAGGVGVLGRRSDRAADLGARQQELQTAKFDDGRQEDERGQLTDVDILADRPQIQDKVST